MKWETFKELKSELKEEYMFRFGKRVEPRYTQYILVMTNFALIIITTMVMYYLMIKDPAFESVLLQMETMFLNVMHLSKFILIFGIVYAVYLVVEVFLYYIYEYIWTKKNTKKVAK